VNGAVGVTLSPQFNNDATCERSCRSGKVDPRRLEMQVNQEYFFI
jgi:hypothetical protein